MINNKLFTSLTLMGLFVFSSCNLDLTPEDTLSPKTYFKNGPQLELWANHFYSLLPDADDLAKQNADDNISSELGETLMGQRSAASEDGWNWDRLRDIISSTPINAQMKMLENIMMEWPISSVHISILKK